jgi:protein involved in polysaccharide export with SLBB domain
VAPRCLGLAWPFPSPPARRRRLPWTWLRPPGVHGIHLGAGDKVRVHVFGDETLSGEHQIDGRGAFTFPLVGSIEAGGLTSTQLEAALETKLKEYMRAPNVSVEILNYRPFYIVGEIRKPGSYPYVDGLTVVNAVAIAGGFTYRARENEFVIQRKPPARLTPGSDTRAAG